MSIPSPGFCDVLTQLEIQTILRDHFLRFRVSAVEIGCRKYDILFAIDFAADTAPLVNALPLSFVESLAKTLDRLAAASCFPSTPNSSPSFFATTVFSISQHISPSPFPAPVENVLRRARYGELWRGVLDEVAQRHHLSQIGLSFLKLLDSDQRTHVTVSSEQDRRIRSNAFLLGELFGSLASDSLARMSLLPLLLDSTKTWSVDMARTMVCWIEISTEKESDRNAVLEKLLASVTEVWGNLDSVANGSAESRTCESSVVVSRTSLRFRCQIYRLYSCSQSRRFRFNIPPSSSCRGLNHF